MNIYDFDNTIFKGDSSVNFIKYSFFKHPWLVIRALLKALKESLKYCFKKSNFGLIKSELFSFVKYIANFDDYMLNYRNKYLKNIKDFYLEQKQENDCVISASFLFIVKPFCEALGIKNVIATEYDVKKGHIIGKNCKGEEKIKRFRKIFPEVEVDEAYSDSLSDIPMFEIAKKAYIVKNDTIVPYKPN